MRGIEMYAGDRRAEAQIRHFWAGGPDIRKVLFSVTFFFLFYAMIYTVTDMNNPGFTIVIELDEASEFSLTQLKRTLECIYDSRSISPTNVEIVVFCACAEPSDHTILRQLRYKPAVEAGGQPHSPYFPIKFLWDFPLSYMSVTAKAVTYKYMAFLPPDVCVDPQWAITLVRKLAWGQAEVVGSRVLAEDGTIEHAGIVYQMAPANLREVPQPAFYLRGYPGSYHRATEDRKVPSVSKVGLGVTKVWFVLHRAFNESLAPHYDALDFSLGTMARGGRVMYCGSCIIHRVSGSDSKLMEYHRAREPPTSQSVLFFSMWAAYLERTLTRQWKSDWAVLISTQISPLAGVPPDALTLLMELEPVLEAKLRNDANPQAQLDLQPFRYPEWIEETLYRLSDRKLHVRKKFVQLSLCGPDGTVPWHSNNAYRIQRCSFKEDATIARWAQSLQSNVHELWVPSTFHRNRGRAHGLPERAIHVFPVFLDLDVWDPHTLSQSDARRMLPVPWPKWAAFTFLSVFRWDDLKGWKELLQAYTEEFHCCAGQTCPDVALLLKTDPPPDSDEAGGGSEPAAESPVLKALVADEMARHLPTGCNAPRVDILAVFMPPSQMTALYRSVEAYVLPSHQEAWGRTYLEAMAMALPTVGVNHGPPLEFMFTNNSFLVEAKVLEGDIPSAQPIVGELRRWLGVIYNNQEAARQVGARARESVRTAHSSEAVANLFLGRLLSIAGNTST